MSSLPVVYTAEAREDLDDPALLGDEDPAVGCEAHRGRKRQAREDRRFLEARRERRSESRAGSDQCRKSGHRSCQSAYEVGLPAFRLGNNLTKWLVGRREKGP